MFVRWQRRKRYVPAFGGWGHDIKDPTQMSRYPFGFVRTRPGTNEQDVHWSAILIESVRIDGRPRQRHIGYLGGITDSAIEITFQRAWFWQHVMQRLDHLANRLSGEERKRVEAALADKVPRLTRPEYEDCLAGWAKYGALVSNKPSFEICGEQLS